MDRAQIKMARLNSAAKLIREKKKVSIFALAVKTGLSVDYARKEYRAIAELYDDIAFDGTTFTLKDQPSEEAKEPQATIECEEM